MAIVAGLGFTRTSMKGIWFDGLTAKQARLAQAAFERMMVLAARKYVAGHVPSWHRALLVGQARRVGKGDPYLTREWCYHMERVRRDKKRKRDPKTGRYLANPKPALLESIRTLK